jgi:hypothetical protein
MRWLFIIVALLASMPARSAETIEKRMVNLVKHICVLPRSPEAVVAAGQEFASAQGWKFDEPKSGRMPFGWMGHSDPDGPPFFITKVWGVPAPAPVGTKFLISIVGPENPNVIMNTCMIFIPGPTFIDEELAQETQRQFKSDLFKSKAKINSNVRHEWYFRQNTNEPINCNKSLMISRDYDPDGNYNMIGVVEIRFPDNDRWKALAEGNNVQNCSK